MGWRGSFSAASVSLLEALEKPVIGRARPQTVFVDQIVHPAPDEAAVTHKASLRCPPGVVLAAVSFALAVSVFAYLAAQLL